MNDFLAQLYNTNGASEKVAEDTTKLANAELFAKLAADNQIDLTKLSEAQIGELYFKTFPEEAQKLAAVEEKKEEPKDKAEAEKKAAAEAYHASKLAEQTEAQAKLAEADFMGRAMAHAMVNELEKIKQAAEEPKKEEKDDKDGDKDKGEKKLPPWLMGKKDEKKEASAKFEELAMAQAVKIAKEANYDEKVAEARVNAVATLGLKESEKIASIQDADGAIHVRGLEYLEAAGYTVNWDEVFSK